MKSFLILACAFALCALGGFISRGEETSVLKKKKSHAAATPKPSSNDENTPAPKKSTSAKKPAGTANGGSDEATPSRKKKVHSSATEDASAPGKTKIAGAKSTPKPTTKTDPAKTTPSLKKLPSVSEDELPLPTKLKSKSADAQTASAIKSRSANPDRGETTPAPAATESNGANAFQKTGRAPSASLEPGELAEFLAQPERVRTLLAAALEFTKLNLTYTFGSAEPANGGMDCSGTIYHVLRAQGFKDVPRDSGSQYVWARKNAQFFAVISTQPDGFEFADLLPGDLMFWTGTYATGRDVPISHVMLYLGREKKSDKRVMFGASDGRSYNGIQRWGVSVFDFKMPRPEHSGEKARVNFVGYARIPGLRDSAEPAAAPSTRDSRSAEAEREPAHAKPNPPAEKNSTPKPAGKKAKPQAGARKPD